jgi:uncharacterized UPF0160 family protein
VARLLAEMTAGRRAKQEYPKAEIKATSDKFEVLREKWASQEGMKSRIGVLVSRMNAHHANTEVINEEFMSAMKASHERIEVLTDVNVKKMVSCVQKFDTNQERIETKMEACVGVELETAGTPED